jgi:hypothetical protein
VDYEFALCLQMEWHVMALWSMHWVGVSYAALLGGSGSLGTPSQKIKIEDNTT